MPSKNFPCLTDLVFGHRFFSKDVRYSVNGVITLKDRRIGQNGLEFQMDALGAALAGMPARQGDIIP